VHIAIVGSRSYPHLDMVRQFVAGLSCADVVVSGGAAGVDSEAHKAAKQRGLACVVVMPDWNGLGRRAGFERNTTIVRLSAFVVAFWDGTSRGTKDTIEKARKAGKLWGVFDGEGIFHGERKD
jgi:hypothetical protein